MWPTRRITRGRASTSPKRDEATNDEWPPCGHFQPIPSETQDAHPPVGCMRWLACLLVILWVVSDWQDSNASPSWIDGHECTSLKSLLAQTENSDDIPPD